MDRDSIYILQAHARHPSMAPSFAIVALGASATEALVLSQVVLSLILPVPMIALLVLTWSRDVMASYATGHMTLATAIAAAASVLMLNLLLVLQIAGVPLPGFNAAG
jgi:manganese transport protein